MKRLLIVGLGVLVSLPWACGQCTNRPHNEAHQLLRHLDTLEDHAGQAARQVWLDSLRNLKIRDRSVATIKHICVTGHQALAKAKRKQRDAERKLDHLATTSQTQVPRHAIKAVRHALDQSNHALKDARVLIRRCHEKAAHLSMKMGRYLRGDS